MPAVIFLVNQEMREDAEKEQKALNSPACLCKKPTEQGPAMGFAVFQGRFPVLSPHFYPQLKR